MKNIAFFAVALFFFMSCKTKQEAAFNYLSRTSTPPEIEALEDKTDKIFQMLVGHFNNKEQADTSATGIFQEQDMIAVPIWTNRVGERWLYMGWFKAGLPDQPLAQGIFQLTRLNRDTFHLKFHLPPAEVENNYYAGEWRKEEPFGELKPRDLIHEEGCQNYVIEREKNLYEIVSAGGKCKRYISEEIRFFDFQGLLSPTWQKHFTVFYNANEEELFSYPKPHGAVYKRIDKAKAPYIEPKKL